MPGTSGNRDFLNLARINEDAAAKMQHAYDQLNKAGADDAALRFTSIDEQIGAGNRNYEDLEGRVDPDRAADELNAARGRLRLRVLISPRWASALRTCLLGWPKSVRFMHLLRNVAVLLPLLFTWLMLGRAAGRYEGLVHASKANGEPFLLLWQEGFGTGSWSFEKVTIVDVILLTAVVALTIWVHWTEAQADRSADIVYAAMDSLKLALGSYSITNPESPAEWAKVTSEALTKAMAQAEAAASRLELLQDTNQKWLEGFQAQTLTLVTGLRDETLKTLQSVDTGNKSFIESATAANREILQTFMKEIVNDQMKPLLGEVRNTVGEFRNQQVAYTAAVTGLTHNVGSIQASATNLAASAQAFTESTQSISTNLESMATSQKEFAAKVDGAAQSMGTAATAMTGVKDVLLTDLKAGIETMSRNVTDASESLRTVEASLATTTKALDTSTKALETSSKDLMNATTHMVNTIREIGPIPRSGRHWPWPFGRRSNVFRDL